jgi:hypothetical protein
MIKLIALSSHKPTVGEVDEKQYVLHAVIPSSCHCIQHSVGRVTSCVEMPRVRYSMKQVFMYNTHVKRRRI